MIEKANFLIAVCSRRNKVDGKSRYLTSTAVREEIAFANAFNKPIICFLEDGVEADGFAGSMYTYKVLQNAENLTPEDLFDIVQGVHDTKLRALDSHQPSLSFGGITNFVVPKLTMQIELCNGREGLYWQYVIEREMEFEADHDYDLVHSAFALEDLAEAKHSPIYDLELKRNGVKEQPTLTAIFSPGGVELKSRLQPRPRKGERVFVRERYRSPYLVPIHAGQKVQRGVEIDGVTLNAYDGVYIINRIHRLELRFVFPKGYVVDEIQPLVATFSNALDHLNDTEIKRLKHSDAFYRDEFDSTVTAGLKIDRPLYQFFYGLAWRLPEEASLPGKIAPPILTWT
ncbi:MAG: hypothetical protein AB7P23_10560 [Amphiplicatus sp.]